MLLNNRSSLPSEEPKLRASRLRMKGSFASAVLFVGSIVPLTLNSQQPLRTTADAASPAFEVAAIKADKGDSGNRNVDASGDRLSIENYTLRQLIRLAYNLKSDKQISGGPDWMDKQAFDVLAKIDDSEMAKMRQMPRCERRRENSLLLQSLLADRFQLRVHEVQQVMPVYALVVAKSKPRLKHSATPGKGYHVSTHNNHMVATATSMDVFADQLTGMTESGDRVVVNRTGLEGDYDFKLDWAPDYGSGVPADAAFPGLLTALREQLGLKLESQKGSIEVIVVDSAAKPTPD